MGILYDMKLMLLYDGADFILNIKPQKGKELIVEWHRGALFLTVNRMGAKKGPHSLPV